MKDFIRSGKSRRFFVLSVLLLGGLLLWQGPAFSSVVKLKQKLDATGRGSLNISAKSGSASTSELAKFCEQYPNDSSCTCSSGTKINYQGKYQCVASTACTALPAYSACTCPSGTKISYEGQYICASSLTCASLPQYASCTCPSGNRIYNDGKYQCVSSVSCNDVPTYASCTCAAGTKIQEGGQYKCATSLACADVPNYASCTCASGETKSASAPYTCTGAGNSCFDSPDSSSCTCPAGFTQQKNSNGIGYNCFESGKCPYFTSQSAGACTCPSDSAKYTMPNGKFVCFRNCDHTSKYNGAWSAPMCECPSGQDRFFNPTASVFRCRAPVRQSLDYCMNLVKTRTMPAPPNDENNGTNWPALYTQYRKAQRDFHEQCGDWLCHAACPGNAHKTRRSRSEIRLSGSTPLLYCGSTYDWDNGNSQMDYLSSYGGYTGLGSSFLCGTNKTY